MSEVQVCPVCQHPRLSTDQWCHTCFTRKVFPKIEKPEKKKKAMKSI